MTREKVKEVITRYRGKFEKLGVVKADYPHEKILDSPGHALEHCHGMLEEMEEFLEQDRLDKAYRWLGFVQGVLWAEKIYPLAELKNHNRKDADAM